LIYTGNKLFKNSLKIILGFQSIQKLIFLYEFYVEKSIIVMDLTENELKDYYLRSVITGDTLGVCIALDNGVNPNTRRRSDFKSALDLAIENECEDIIDIIKEYRNVFSSIQNPYVEKYDNAFSYNITDSDSSEENDLNFKNIETIFPSSSNFFTSEA